MRLTTAIAMDIFFINSHFIFLVATKASVLFAEANDNIFSQICDCCKERAEIKYFNNEKKHIAGRSVYGSRKSKDGINFQVVYNEKNSTMDVYDYAKRGMDRRLVDALLNMISSTEENLSIKVKDLDECGVCRKKLRVGSPRYIPSIGWETFSELCESCYTLLSEHEKTYCCVCQKKLGFRKYPAKISWNGNLLLCKDCRSITDQSPNYGFKNLRGTNDKTSPRSISTTNFSQKNIRKLMENPILIGSDDPLHILKIRLARGEVSSDDFKEMRKLLEE
jgi:hypothetical protein